MGVTQAEMVSDPLFIQARNYTKTGSERQVDLIVVHDMEHPEVPGAAKQVAQWFASATAPIASAHYNVDEKQVVQSVRDDDVAWHAPGSNAIGIGIEHAGYANQTSADWDDVYSRAMLVLSAKLVARLCLKHRIPVVWLSPQELVQGKRGITSHANVSKAWRKSTHTDPGPGFPVDFYIRLVKSNMVQAASTNIPGDIVTVPETEEETVQGLVAIRPQGGYIVVAPDGGVFTYDGAPFLGSIPGTSGAQLTTPPAGAAWTPTGEGYWIVTKDGSVFAFGDAKHLGGFNQEPAKTRGSREVVGILPFAKGYKIIAFEKDGDYDTYFYGQVQ